MLRSSGTCKSGGWANQQEKFIEMSCTQKVLHHSGDIIPFLSLGFPPRRFLGGGFGLDRCVSGGRRDVGVLRPFPPPPAAQACERREEGRRRRRPPPPPPPTVQACERREEGRRRRRPPPPPPPTAQACERWEEGRRRRPPPPPPPSSSDASWRARPPPLLLLGFGGVARVAGNQRPYPASRLPLFLLLGGVAGSRRPRLAHSSLSRRPLLPHHRRQAPGRRRRRRRGGRVLNRVQQLHFILLLLLFTSSRGQDERFQPAQKRNNWQGWRLGHTKLIRSLESILQKFLEWRLISPLGVASEQTVDFIRVIRTKPSQEFGLGGVPALCPSFAQELRLAKRPLSGPAKLTCWNLRPALLPRRLCLSPLLRSPSWLCLPAPS